MNAKDVINDIKAVLSNTKADNNQSISIDAMQRYLDALEKDVGNDTYYQSLNQESNLAVFKAENDRNIAFANNESTHSLEMFKSVMTSGQSALKSSMIINGGAAVALLAFTGRIWNSTISSEVSSSLSSSIFLFCLGILLAAFASGLTYLTQFCYSSDWNKLGNVINVVTVLSVLVSYYLFGYSSYVSSMSFGAHLG